jgi:hypothetical protein
VNSRQAGMATFLISSKVIHVSFKSAQARCDRPNAAPARRGSAGAAGEGALPIDFDTILGLSASILYHTAVSTGHAYWIT